MNAPLPTGVTSSAYRLAHSIWSVSVLSCRRHTDTCITREKTPFGSAKSTDQIKDTMKLFGFESFDYIEWTATAILLILILTVSVEEFIHKTKRIATSPSTVLVGPAAKPCTQRCTEQSLSSASFSSWCCDCVSSTCARRTQKRRSGIHRARRPARAPSELRRVRRGTSRGGALAADDSSRAVWGRNAMQNELWRGGLRERMVICLRMKSLI